MAAAIRGLRAVVQLVGFFNFVLTSCFSSIRAVVVSVRPSIEDHEFCASDEFCFRFPSILLSLSCLLSAFVT